MQEDYDGLSWDQAMQLCVKGSARLSRADMNFLLRMSNIEHKRTPTDRHRLVSLVRKLRQTQMALPAAAAGG